MVELASRIGRRRNPGTGILAIGRRREARQVKVSHGRGVVYSV